MMRVDIALPADVQIRRLDALLRSRIEEKIRRLGETLDLGKPLHGPLAGLRSLRLGDYRVIYKTYSKVRRLAVLRVAHRKEVHR